MSENRTGRTGGFIGYEYKEVVTDPGQASFLMDGYANFGWEVDENVMPGGLEKYPERAGSPQHRKTVIRLKRDRKIINKMELTRLQRHFEACLRELDQLEESRTARARICAVMTGILGTAFLAGSTFAVTHQPPMVALMVVLAVPGFAGWIAPWFLYRAMVRRRAQVVDKLVEQKYDEIYDLCAKGHSLL